MRRTILALTPLLLLALPGRVEAADPAEVRGAIEKSLPLLQQGARTFRERSEGRCIACHHQGPLQLVVALARERGFRIDEELERAELDRIRGFYARRQELYRRALTDPDAARQADRFGNFTVHVGYWLSGYAAEGGPSDEATATAALFLASRQAADGHWDFDDTARAPLQASDFTTTALAVRVLQKYGPKDRAEELAGRIDRAGRWVLRSTPRTTDDKVYRLHGLAWTGAARDEIRTAADTLAAEQRADGGWAQQENMPSDAYATGLVLVALHQSGGLDASSAVYRRGVDYLMTTRMKDGSWFVRTRAIPSNPYFESGFPHGRSQFISYAGTCHAVMALTLTVERK
ncbi:MAG TPA: prenyltransferase/squalene oxidase repeat-containing protein [Gemmataceae bacterium]|nr:prenyltransferase/squalene oxidase repeat-containing protein [Gemmataceae bacterium]